MQTHDTLARSIRIALAAAALGLAAPLAVSAGPTLVALAATGSLVQQGQSALDAGDHAKAIALFTEAAKAGGADADSAAYWKAYAEFRAGRAADARRSLDQFLANYPKSRWVKDARALNVDVNVALGRTPAPDKTEDEELKLYALDGLMQMEPAKALPILKRFMAGPHSTRLKERALFVASQSDLPEAKQLVLTAARDNANPDLQRRAILVLGSADDPQMQKALLEVYRSGADPRVRRAVLEAWVASDAKAEILAAAKSEADVGLRRHAIQMLGAVDATEELRNLARTEKEPSVRRAILDGLVAADDEEAIYEMAKRETDVGVRRHAIHMLGAVEASDQLRELLRTETDASVRRAIIDAFVAADDADMLLEIARSEKDPAVRRHAIQMLGAVAEEEAKGGGASSAMFEQLYTSSTDVGEKSAVLDALLMRDDVKTLLKLYRTETEPRLKRRMVQALSQMDSPEAQQAVIDILDK